ncbi:MAG: hypothetical protein HLUCCA08_10595 [Rhodobacteraceae bacterium HLUCCA08]|nr:MAG: hypothetical protein HLUCCA08_10595 [Rhodobacteraceae bacterium HLUCCA08]
MAEGRTLSGLWTGRYDYARPGMGDPVTFEVVLTETGRVFTGELVEPNTFRDDAGDTLMAVVSGSRDGQFVQFLKTYTDFNGLDHPVYEGRCNGALTRISGDWRFPAFPAVCGSFLMVRTAGLAEEKAREAKAEAEIEI